MESIFNGKGFLGKLEDKIAGMKWDIWIISTLSFLIAFLLYDFKVSEGGDDSAYIFRAFDLVNQGTYPSFQGPLYPMFLGLIIAIFGLKIQLLKISSLLCMVLFFFLTYRVLKNRVPKLALLGSLIIAALSPMFMYFSSQTYSEVFYLCIQTGMIAYFLKHYIENTSAPSWKAHLIIALWIWIMGNTRTVGYAALPAIWLFLASNKEWKSLAWITASFAAVFAFLQFVKSMIWNTGDVQFASQGSTLLLKDPYTPTNGNENLMGFIERFGRNAELYLSKHYLKFLGLKETLNNETSLVVTLLVVFLLLGTLVYTWKKNPALRFINLLILASVGLTLFAVQTRWDQFRLIAPYLPFISLIILSGLTYLSSDKRFSFLQYGIPLAIVMLALNVFSKGRVEISEKQVEFKQAIGGDVLAGYTPDWQSFIQMSEYAAEFAPDSVMIASRKAGISFIYGKRKFKGITRLPFTHRDSIDWKDSDWMIVEGNTLDSDLLQLQLTRSSIRSLVFGEAPKDTEQGKGQFYILLEVDKKNLAMADSLQIKHWTDINSFLDGYTELNLAEPDRMVKLLKEYRIKYVILANLRRNPLQKTQFTINTISRFLYYIQMKYPGAFRAVYSIGTSEPAQLVEVNFQAFKS